MFFFCCVIFCPFFVLVTIWFSTTFYFTFCVPCKKVIQVWNDMVTNWWQIVFISGWTVHSSKKYNSCLSRISAIIQTEDFRWSWDLMLPKEWGEQRRKTEWERRSRTALWASYVTIPAEFLLHSPSRIRVCAVEQCEIHSLKATMCWDWNSLRAVNHHAHARVYILWDKICTYTNTLINCF